MQRVNIILGRFQPITVEGHLKIAKNIYKSRNFKSVLCVIDTTKPDEKHPFITKLIWSSLKALINDYDEIQDIVLVRSADIMKIGEACAVKGYTPVTWGCGTDRYDSYYKMCKRYAPDIEVIEIKRDDADISASKVREFIKKGDKQAFEDATPKSFHKLFDKLKEAIDAIE